MISLPGYQITQKIYTSKSSLVYRGYQSPTRLPVVLKVLRQEYPSPEELIRYKQEYQITHYLQLGEVIKAYHLEKYKNTLVIIFEDFGGESLHYLWRSPKNPRSNIPKFTLKETLKIALKIISGLSKIHAANIIHKDINPSNIVFNPTTGQLKIIDFGISTILPHSIANIKNPDIIEGTLPYISPEQTGRLNAQIDYRSDFYSLGVTLYELFTKQLPFNSNDSLEVIHYHLAKKPIAPRLLNPEIPDILSEIILKLLAKKPENRYQSSWGIKADLGLCLTHLNEKITLIDFALGKYDFADKFQIPQKLYGREQEIEILSTTFSRVTSTKKKYASSEIILISGYPGSGKSALVKEIYLPLTEARGYFISGLFEQSKTNIPYSGLIQALRNLVEQLLTESEEKLNIWRKKIGTALGINAQVIINVIPELKLIIGEQYPVTHLPPSEAKNRFNLVLKNFVHVFTQPEHPLVIFLDNLHWADTESLGLIKDLITIDSQYLLLIGAYRQNQLSQSPVLQYTIEKIKQASIKVNEIYLSPLKLVDIVQLLSDTFKYATQSYYSLATWVQTKTHGNPFFIKEFLTSLYQEKAIYFDSIQGKWNWNLDVIASKKITENVVELMVNKISNLQLDTQKLLKRAACIGTEFDLHTLTAISNESPHKIIKFLDEAIREGLIIPPNDTYTLLNLDETINLEKYIISYQFLHNDIQQAAYLLIPDKEKKLIHQKLGDLLIKETKIVERKKNIFTLVNHLNLAADLRQTSRDRKQLATLNFQAAKRAKSTTAHELAFNYCKKAIELLPVDIWFTDYQLSLELYNLGAETASLSGDYSAMEKLGKVIENNAQNILDKVKIYEVRIQAYKSQNKPWKAIKISLDILNFLGIKLPLKPKAWQIFLSWLKTQLFLIFQRFLPNIRVTETQNVYELATMRILVATSIATYLAAPQLLALIVFKLRRLSLRYSQTAEAAFAYAAYGLILCSKVEAVESGYQSGKVALKLLSQLNSQQFKAKILYLFNIFMRHWRESLRDSLPSLQIAYQSALEHGDFEFAALILHSHDNNLLFVGENLVTVEQKMQDSTNILRQLKQEMMIRFNQLDQQLVANLLDCCDNPQELVGEYFQEDQLLPLYRQQNLPTIIVQVYLYKAILNYLWENYTEATLNLGMVAKYLEAISGSYLATCYNFYDSLTRLALFPQTTPSQQHQIKEKVAFNQQKMRKWASLAPVNYLHKFYLVEAERCKIAEKKHQARDYYELAVELAQKHQFTHEEALGYELTAKFYLSNRKKKLAQIYMKDAHYTYGKWGAIAKLRHLERNYSELLSFTHNYPSAISLGNLSESPYHIQNSITTERSSSEALDKKTVLKASQVLAKKIVLDELLQELMKIMIENAGAQTGILVLKKEEQLWIQAQGFIDPDLVSIYTLPLKEAQNLLPLSIVNYVARTGETLVVDDATCDHLFAKDDYIKANQPKSILCLPIIHQSQFIGLLYLENNLTTNVFTPQRQEVLSILASQSAISLQNAQLYVELKESKSKLDQFLEAVPVGIYVVDARGKLYYANQTASKIVKQEIKINTDARKLPEIYQAYIRGTQKLYPQSKQPILRALNGESVSIDDLEIHVQGEVIPLEISATPIFDDKGEIIYAIAVLNDITERIKFTQELQEAKQKLADYSQNLAEKVKEQTKELSQTLDILKATQAKLILENNLLRNAEDLSSFDYQVGGSLPLEAPTYVVRSADRYFYQAIRKGEFCYILHPRQMGKSSLMVRMVHHLQGEGYCCAPIDMTRIGSEEITAVQWYKGFAYELVRRFNLSNQVNLKLWWQERTDLSPVQRLGEFIESIILPLVGNGTQPIVIFIDEIDNVLTLKFPVSDFFALIRSCYNLRGLNPEYRRLTFAIFGVASPNQLINNVQTTPFNIGQSIQLEGFKEHEAQPLLQGLTDKVNNPQTLLKELLSWTRGQPFLTQKLCKLVRNIPATETITNEARWLGELVQQHIINNWEMQDEPEHLRTIRDRLLYSSQSSSLLQLYRHILTQNNIRDPDNLVSRELILSGLVVKKGEFLDIHNPIYAAIFNQDWLAKQTLP